VRQINSSECNHSGHSDGGGSRSGKAEGGVDPVIVSLLVIVVVTQERNVRIAGLFSVVVRLLTVFVTLFTLFVRLLTVFVTLFTLFVRLLTVFVTLFTLFVRLLTVFVTLFTLFVRLLVGFTVLIVSLTLSIVVRLLLFFFGAVVDISGAFGFIFEDIAREFGNLIGVVVLVDGDVGNLVSCLDNSVVTSVGICTSKHS